MNDSMKPLAKTVTGVALLLAGVAGCASAPTTTSTAPVASYPGSGATSTPSPSAAPDSPAPSPSVSTAPTPTSSAPGGIKLPTVITTPPTGRPVPSLPPTAAGDQVKYTSPTGVSVSTDGKTVTSSVEWGGCTDQPQLIVLSQDSAQVVIEVRTVSHHKTGQMCPTIMRIGEASAVLDAPLGTRKLVDGITNGPALTR